MHGHNLCEELNVWLKEKKFPNNSIDNRLVWLESGGMVETELLLG